MAKVLLELVDKVYPNGTQVLDKVSLEVRDEEFLVLVGPSGCGKSTILRMIAGLEEVTGGTVTIGNDVVNEMPPRKRDIAMVFQNYALYPHLNAYDNMAFGLKLRKTDKSEIEERVRGAARILGIEALLDKQPKALSGGERQRVALGRAIVRQPRVFLFDEPLSNLDAKLRSEMRAEITSLHRKLRVTTVYVTHDQVEAMTMGQRIVVLNKGEIQQIGAPMEIYDRPVNRFVASFVGNPSMNSFDANIVEGGVETCGTILASDRLPRAGRITLGLRPEHLELDPAGPIEGKVDLVEPTGGEAFVYLNVGQASAGQHQIVVRTAATGTLAVGDTVRLKPDMSRAHFFDPETEERIEP